MADLTSEQLERIRENSHALIEQSAYPDPILCVIAAYVAEVNEEFARLENHDDGALN